MGWFADGMLPKSVTNVDTRKGYVVLAKLGKPIYRRKILRIISGSLRVVKNGNLSKLLVT